MENQDRSITFQLSICLIVVLLGSRFGIVCGYRCYDNLGGSLEECDGSVCEVYCQQNQILQACDSSVFAVAVCELQGPGIVKEDVDSLRPYHMCCLSDLCNIPDAFIDKCSPKPPSSSSSSSSSSFTTNMTSTILPSLTSSQTSSTSVHSLSSSCSSCNSVTYSATSSTSIRTTVSQLSTSVFHPISTLQIGPTMIEGSSSTKPPDYAIAVICILAILLVVFIIIIFVVTFLHFYPRHVIGAAPAESDGTPTCTLSTECGDLEDNMFKHAFEGTTSGSGAGHPLLVQRSIAAQVTLREIIGKGRFGEVRKGSYKGDAVAVKIFHTKEEASWLHEVDIYQTCLIRHPNILRFIAADNKDGGMSMELWLITEFCDNGSLYDVLINNTLDQKTMLKLCYTSASGLAHLHSEIIGTEGKPAIAHRDIKSRNILVKSDFTCCLADLGLALRYYRDKDKVEDPPTKRVGTRRYLSPEILSDTMNVGNFDSFKRSDMYSFGLVMWEIARRGQCAGSSEDYQLPYFDLVNPDPTFEDMKRVVAIEKKRPGFPNRWSQSEVFHSLSQIIEQCWHSDGEARVTALRVKKNLANLQSLLNEDDKKNDTVVV